MELPFPKMFTTSLKYPASTVQKYLDSLNSVEDISHLQEGLHCTALILITSNYSRTLGLVFISFTQVFLTGCLVNMAVN